jgi:hypothetical protein
MIRRLIGGLTAILICMPIVGESQSSGVDVRPLSGPFYEFPEPFSNIGELAEFPDRRILLVDFRERRVLIVDMARETAEDAAREGGGPLEFRSSSPVIATSDGRVMVWDVVQDRILVFEANGRPSGTRPANVQQPFAALPRAADSAGALYGEFRGWKNSTSGLVQEDSSVVLRQRGRSVDTVAFLRPEFESHRTARDRNFVRPSGFRAFDAWGVFRDGTVLIVRGTDYVPEIVTPTGGRRRLSAIPFERIPVTDRDRREQMRALQQMLDDARRRGSGAAPSLMGSVRVAEPFQWAQYKPAVRDAVIRIDSRSRAWVAAYDRAESLGQRFDLFDAGGRRLGAFRLPSGERLVGFGREVVFTARSDSDDLVFLRRYPLP